ncbi:MAG: HAD-IB family phosphatase [bacterium]
MYEMKFRPGFSTVIFDCDYTLSTIQGINELADASNDPKVAKLIHDLTLNVVSGKITLEEVFAERIALAKPSRQQLEELGKRYTENITTGAKEVVEALQYLGKKVYIMSHGYKAAVDILADYLTIPRERVFAVELGFDEQGNYSHLEIDQPLVNSTGKTQCINDIGTPKEEILFVGDGPLDLDVIPNVGMFVGFGGIKEHKLVKKTAEFYLTCPSLLPILFIATSAMEKNLLQATDYQNLVTESFILTQNHLLCKNPKN